MVSSRKSREQLVGQVVVAGDVALRADAVVVLLDAGGARCTSDATTGTPAAPAWPCRGPSGSAAPTSSSLSQSPAMYASPKPISPSRPSRDRNCSGRRTTIVGAPSLPHALPSGSVMRTPVCWTTRLSRILATPARKRVGATGAMSGQRWRSTDRGASRSWVVLMTLPSVVDERDEVRCAGLGGTAVPPASGSGRWCATTRRRWRARPRAAAVGPCGSLAAWRRTAAAHHARG